MLSLIKQIFMCLAIKIRNQEEDGFFKFMVLHVHELAGTDFLEVGLLRACVLWGFCWAFSLKISTWVALEGLQGIYFERHFEYHKMFLFMSTAFAFKVLWIPLWWRVTCFLALPHPFSPCSWAIPKLSRLSFWGTVEPIGDPQFSGARVTALGTAAQWGGIIWNYINFRHCFSMLLRILDFSTSAFSFCFLFLSLQISDYAFSTHHRVPI